MPCLGTSCCTHQRPCVPGDIVSLALRTWEKVLAKVLAMPMSGNQYLHLPVTLHTLRYWFQVYSVQGEIKEGLLARLLHREPVPALTSDPVYPMILFPQQFGPGIGC